MSKEYTVRKLRINTGDEISQESYSDIIEKSELKYILHTCVYEAIQYANKRKRKFAKVIEIGLTRVILQIEREHWVPALENMIKFYERTEDYDRCRKIKNLIDNIV